MQKGQNDLAVGRDPQVRVQRCIYPSQQNPPPVSALARSVSAQWRWENQDLQARLNLG